MYNLHLSAEQLEIRDTVRGFVTREVKPVVLKADRLDACDRRLPMALLEKASQLGLRTLALSEQRGGAGADNLTCCIVTEELAAGDADIAATLAETARLGHILFDRAMSDAQRERLLPPFLDNDRCQLAFAHHEPDTDTRLGVNYHRPATGGNDIKTTAVKSENGDWIVNGVKDCVANAPVAGLLAVLVHTSRGQAVLIVAADAPGLTVRAHERAWRHGPCGEVMFKDCRVPAENLLGDDAGHLLARDEASGRANPLMQAINLGVGRAAYEAAVDYARLRVQGGRPHRRASGDRHEARRDRHQARSGARRGLAGGMGVGSCRRLCRPQPCRSAAADDGASVRVRDDAERNQGRRRSVRRHGRHARHADAEIRPRRPHLSAQRRRQSRRQAAHRRGAGRLSPAVDRGRGGGIAFHTHEDVLMDFALSNEQRDWQMTARKFAEEEIRPISLARDEIPTAHETFDWEIVRKGSKLGFRTMAVPKEYGGEGTDFVTQALVMAELARADSAISKTFSQNWKWSHLISHACTDEQKARFLRPFVADDTFLLGKGISEPGAGSDNRLPPADDPKAGLKLRAERKGDEWILNGEKCFIANAPVGKLFFIDARTDPAAPLKQGTTLFLVPRDTPGFRIGKVFNKSGWRFYQNGEMIFEDARVPHANVVGEINGGARKAGGGGGDTTGGDIFGDLELCANALGICDDACETALRYARTTKQGGRILFEQQIVQLEINKMHMLTEALRSFVLRVAWEHDKKIRSCNAGLAMNFSTDVVQQVTELYMDIRGVEGCSMDHHADKLVRDSIIWSHLAGDSVQRMKVARRLAN